MEKKTETIENFKRAITSTVKSIVGDEHVEVIFGNEVNKENKKTISLPSLKNTNDKEAQIFTQQAETVRLVSTEKENIAVTDLTIGQYILGWSDPDARHIGVAVPSEVVER